MATGRLNIRLDKEIKTKAEKVSDLIELKSPTKYVVSLINSNATKVIAQHESMTIHNGLLGQFIDSCEKAKEPSKNLLMP